MEFKDRMRLDVFFVSAKNFRQIDGMFNKIKTLCLQDKIKGIEINKKNKNLSLSVINPKKPSSGCCN